MKVYMVTSGVEVSDDYVFTDYEQARQRLIELRAEENERAEREGDASDAELYELRVFKLVQIVGS